MHKAMRATLAALLVPPMMVAGVPAHAQSAPPVEVAQAIEVAQASAPAAAAIRAGVAGAVRGKVERISANAVGTLKSGETVFLRDEIRTGPDAGLQIILLDQTIFTIGPNAAMAIDEFVFDPSKGAGKLTARVVQGAFRFVSGQVAKDDPKNMTVNLPHGTIGVRGTAAEGMVGATDSLVVLRGPGPNNNANEREGRIEVGNATGGVLITRPGFGTQIGRDVAPTDPQRLTTDQLGRITAGFTPRAAGGETQGEQSPGGQQGQQGQGGQQGQQGQQNRQGPQGQGGASGNNAGAGQKGNVGGDGKGVVNRSGQGSAGAIGNVGNTNALTRLGQALNQQTVKAVQDTSATLTEITTFSQLRSLKSGSGTYETGTTNLVAIDGTGNGSYTVKMVIDYGQRKATFTLTGTFTVGSVTGNIAPNGGPVIENYSSDQGSISKRTTSFTPTAGGVGTIFTSVLNEVSSRTIAKMADLRVEIKDTVAGVNRIGTEGGSTRVTRQ